MPKIPNRENFGPRPIPRASNLIPSFQPSQTGNALREISADIRQYANDLQRREDEANIFEARRRLNEWEQSYIYDPEKGAVTRQGKNAFGLTDEVPKSFDQASHEIYKSLKSDRQRELFTEMAESRREHWNQWASTYELKNRESYLDEQYEADVSSLKDRISFYSRDDDVVNTESSLLRARVENHLKARGKDGNVISQEIQSHLSTAHAKAIDGLLADDDYTTAQVYFDKHRKAIDNTVAENVSRTLGAYKGRMQAVARAKVMSQLEDVETAASLGQVMTIDDEAFNVLEPEERKELKDRYRDSQDLQKAISTMPKMSAEQLADYMEKAQPKVGEGLARKQKVYEAKQRALQIMLKQQSEDPAAYMIAHSPIVSKLFSDVGEREGLLDSILNTGQVERDITSRSEAYADAVIAEQDRVGIVDHRVLPKAMRDQIIRQFNDRSVGGEGPATLITGLSTQWGKHWPTVFAELKKDLPTSAIVLGDGVTGQAAEVLGRLGNVKAEELRKGFDAGTVQDVTADVNGRVADFLQITSSTNNGILTGNAFRDSMINLSLYYLRNGKSQGDAVDLAYDQLIGDRYEMHGTYMVPKHIDSSEIENGAEDALGFLTVSDISVANIQSILPDDLNADAYLEAIKSDGYWVSDEGKKGLGLFIGGAPVLDKDGDPLFKTWDELRQEPSKHQEKKDSRCLPGFRWKYGTCMPEETYENYVAQERAASATPSAPGATAARVAVGADPTESAPPHLRLGEAPSAQARGLIERTPNLNTDARAARAKDYIVKTKNREGGFTIDSAGGPTKAGATKTFLERFLNKTLSADEVRDMPMEIIDKSYEDLLERTGINNIDDSDIGELLFDSSVHHGEGVVKTWFQNYLGVEADGYIGPKTAKALAARDPKKVYNHLLTTRGNQMARLMSMPGNTKKQRTYICAANGWYNRWSGFIKDYSTGPAVERAVNAMRKAREKAIETRDRLNLNCGDYL